MYVIKSSYVFLGARSRCGAKVDVGFILDSSGSLGRNYELEKEFLKDLASSFGINEDGARLGIVTFSDAAEHSIKLIEHKNIDSFR